MSYLVKLLLSALIELGVKYAEKKFNEAKSGDNKKAYILNKIDTLFDDNVASEYKTEAMTIANKEIDKKVDQLFNKK